MLAVSVPDIYYQMLAARWVPCELPSPGQGATPRAWLVLAARDTQLRLRQRPKLMLTTGNLS